MFVRIDENFRNQMQKSGKISKVYHIPASAREKTENGIIFQPFQPFQPKWQPCVQGTQNSYKMLFPTSKLDFPEILHQIVIIPIFLVKKCPIGHDSTRVYVFNYRLQGIKNCQLILPKVLKPFLLIKVNF